MRLREKYEIYIPHIHHKHKLCFIASFFNTGHLPIDHGSCFITTGAISAEKVLKFLVLPTVLLKIMLTVTSLYDHNCGSIYADIDCFMRLIR